MRLQRLVGWSWAHRDPVVALLVAILTCGFGAAQTGLKGPPTNRTEANEWARSRSSLQDNVRIKYLKWTWTHEATVRADRVMVFEWQRSVRGELQAQWSIPKNKVKDWTNQSFDPRAWEDGAMQHVLRQCDEVTHTNPPSWTCYQEGRYSKWSKNRSGTWDGEKLASGDVFLLRDQVHMAIGMTFLGKWVTPEYLAAKELAFPGINELVITAPDEACMFRYGLDGRLVAIEAGPTKAKNVSKVTVHETRDADRHSWIPKIVLVIPDKREHLPMGFCVMECESGTSIPEELLDRPPLASGEQVQINTLVDRVSDVRADPESISPDHIMREVAETNVGGRGGGLMRMLLWGAASAILVCLLGVAVVVKSKDKQSPSIDDMRGE